MKNLVFLFCLIFLSACSSPEQTKTPSKEKTVAPNFDWLLGSWQRTNDNEGRETFENWKKISEKEYVGLGYTLAEKDTVFKENLRLVPINGIWNYEVTGVNESPTFFEFTSQTNSSFVCENGKNEFPKKIEYVLHGKRLEANISAGEMKIAFSFQRLE